MNPKSEHLHTWDEHLNEHRVKDAHDPTCRYCIHRAALLADPRFHGSPPGVSRDTERPGSFSFAFDVTGRCDMTCDHCSWSVEIDAFTSLADLIDAAEEHTSAHPPPAPGEPPE